MSSSMIEFEFEFEFEFDFDAGAPLETLPCAILQLALDFNLFR